MRPGDKIRLKHKPWVNCASQGTVGGQGLEFIPCNCPTGLVKLITGETVVLKSALDGRLCFETKELEAACE